MRKLFLTATLIASTCGVAIAENATTISLTVDDACAFQSPNIVAEIFPSIGEYNVGSLTFACNFLGNANVTLSVPGGTELRSGPNKARYQIRWDVAPFGHVYRGSSEGASNFTETFSVQTGAVQLTNVTGAVWVKLTQNPTAAGIYTSVATYTIAP